ncbi:unnamed protein product [Adineta steineri]|uniref:B box-type domain-containing protein n=1 Tax=Adineta steineri TaxID=433720 RepID=A0A818JUF6_9BILA|nr:unnamed protein product [Adineta steineri]
MKQDCIKCQKCVKLSTCHGCQQTFCNEHIIEHREELAHKIDNIHKEYHQFDNKLNTNNVIQPYISRIDQWEHESIDKIKKTAETARNDLLKIHDRMKNQLKLSIDKINKDIQSTRQTIDYTENDLNEWTKQLKQLRHIHKSSFNDDVIDDSQGSIRLIKIIDEKQSIFPDGVEIIPREKFIKIPDKIPTLQDDQKKQRIKRISVSRDSSTGTCLKPGWNGATICCKNLYISGIHSIRFRIEKQGTNNPFFGITSALKEPNPWNRKTPLAYGWWEIPVPNDKLDLYKGNNDTKENNDRREKTNFKDFCMRTGDEITLTLNCTNNEIELENHRTKQYIYERVAYEKCPFPWRIAIVLYSPGDSISILS